jgi:hypothetical protein
MGRPLNKKYFGNRNIGSASTTADDGIGGQGVASITLGGTNNSSGYALNDPIEISAPNLTGGVQATAKVTELGAGNKIIAITVTEQGSGYTSVPTVTESVGGVQGTLTFTAVLTVDSGNVGSATNDENAIRPYAVVTSGTRQVADIIRQVSTDRYKVKTADGTMICKLVTDGVANAAGEMDLTAYDAAAGEYWVKKLTGRRATLVSKGVGGGTEFATNSSAPWKFDDAVTGYVQINNK